MCGSPSRVCPNLPVRKAPDRQHGLFGSQSARLARLTIPNLRPPTERGSGPAVDELQRRGEGSTVARGLPVRSGVRGPGGRAGSSGFWTACVPGGPGKWRAKRPSPMPQAIRARLLDPAVHLGRLPRIATEDRGSVDHDHEVAREARHDHRAGPAPDLSPLRLGGATRKPARNGGVLRLCHLDVPDLLQRNGPADGPMERHRVAEKKTASIGEDSSATRCPPVTEHALPLGQFLGVKAMGPFPHRSVSRSTPKSTHYLPLAAGPSNTGSASLCPVCSDRPPHP